MLTRLLAALLIIEAFGTAQWLVPLLPSLGGYDRSSLLLIAARATIGALQLTSGGLLWRSREPGFALGAYALFVSAVLRIFEVGLRLTPSNADPTFRWWFVGAYAGYALVAAGWLRRRRPR